MSEITTFEPTAIDDSPVLHAAACSYCGAPIEQFDQFCPACGGRQASETESVEEDKKQLQHRRFQCKNCGAEVAVEPQQRSYTCAFCDSTYVVELPRDFSGRQPPEFVIPFGIALEDAQNKFQQWIRAGGLFRPGNLHKARIEEKLHGVYLPFWSFSMLAESRWSASIGEHWYRTETYTVRQNGKTVTKTRTVTETEWWPLDGRHHRYYSGYLVSGSRGLSQRDAQRVKPFHLAALKRYRPEFLAGWLGEVYSVEREEALDMCKQEFIRREQNNIAAHMPGDKHRSLNVETEFSQINSDLILLPIFLLSYKHGDKLFRFMVNGQTGRVVGDKPLSPWKICLVVGLGLLFLLVLFIFASGML
ncbi:MAG: zinc ribbon domain-containing protein [Pirellulales bacterium]|nr:zinc ribbon domain-containing protein [Pirellulales bacterium]